MVEEGDVDRGWAHFPHGSDIGIEGRGLSLARAFEQAALGLTAAVTGAKIKLDTTLEVTCEAPDRERLLVAWLDSIIYEMATRNMLFGQFQVHLSNGRLQAKLWGESIDPMRHEPACEPKGATYTELKVLEDDNGVWSARCVVDV